MRSIEEIRYSLIDDPNVRRLRPGQYSLLEPASEQDLRGIDDHREHKDIQNIATLIREGKWEEFLQIYTKQPDAHYILLAAFCFCKDPLLRETELATAFQFLLIAQDIGLENCIIYRKEGSHSLKLGEGYIQLTTEEMNAIPSNEQVAIGIKSGSIDPDILDRFNEILESGQREGMSCSYYEGMTGTIICPSFSIFKGVLKDEKNKQKLTPTLAFTSRDHYLNSILSGASEVAMLTPASIPGAIIHGYTIKNKGMPALLYVHDIAFHTVFRILNKIPASQRMSTLVTEINNLAKDRPAFSEGVHELHNVYVFPVLAGNPTIQDIITKSLSDLAGIFIDGITGTVMIEEIEKYSKKNRYSLNLDPIMVSLKDLLTVDQDDTPDGENKPAQISELAKDAVLDWIEEQLLHILDNKIGIMPEEGVIITAEDRLRELNEEKDQWIKDIRLEKYGSTPASYEAIFEKTDFIDTVCADFELYKSFILSTSYHVNEKFYSYPEVIKLVQDLIDKQLIEMNLENMDTLDALDKLGSFYEEIPDNEIFLDEKMINRHFDKHWAPCVNKIISDPALLKKVWHSEEGDRYMEDDKQILLDVLFYGKSIEEKMEALHNDENIRHMIAEHIILDPDNLEIFLDFFIKNYDATSRTKMDLIDFLVPFHEEVCSAFLSKSDGNTQYSATEQMLKLKVEQTKFLECLRYSFGKEVLEDWKLTINMISTLKGKREMIEECFQDYKNATPENQPEMTEECFQDYLRESLENQREACLNVGIILEMSRKDEVKTLLEDHSLDVVDDILELRKKALAEQDKIPEYNERRSDTHHVDYSAHEDAVVKLGKAYIEGRELKQKAGSSLKNR